MDVALALEEMRSEVAGCDLIAFADLSSQMVLCTSSATKRAQEEIDALTGVASVTLKGALAEGAQALTGDEPATAVTMTRNDVHVYMRNPAAANEALICVCAPDADIGKVVDCGHAMLGRMVAEG